MDTVKFNNTMHQGTVFENMGNNNLNKNKPAQALKCYTVALTFYKRASKLAKNNEQKNKSSMAINSCEKLIHSVETKTDIYIK